MELREVADLFDGVRMNGRGFQAKCPAHDDTHPSLTVTQGKTGWLVSCHVGCSFFDITRALGVSPIVFKFGGTSATSALGSPLDARRKLGSMIRESRRIPYRFIDLAEIALGVRSAAGEVHRNPDRGDNLSIGYGDQLVTLTTIRDPM